VIALAQINVDKYKTSLNNNYVPRNELDERFKSQEKRVTDLESNQTWIYRLVIGWIVLGVLAAIFITTGGI
jgi:type IV secretory pathway component VirB8